MDFTLNEQQSAIIDLAKQFARDELAPYAAEWDRDEIFPVDVLKKSAQLGFAGIYCKSEVGGSELSRLDAALIFEALSAGCVSTAAYLSIHNMVAWLIDTYASDELRQAYLPDLCNMQRLASYCLTEPGSGSDAAALKTTAELKNNQYILNGSKSFISGGGSSDVYIVMARTGDDSPRGISCFIVDKDTPGLSFGNKEHKLGWHSQPTRMVYFNDCKIPASNLIADEGMGFKIALTALNGGRVNIAACSLGGAQAALDATGQYLVEREQFKQALATQQTIQFKFADMLTELEAAKLMTYRAAASIDKQDAELATHCAMAKRYATDVCFDISNQCLQLHGGYGYLQDYPVERIMRDLRAHPIIEGTNEIMRLIIARNTLLRAL